MRRALARKMKRFGPDARAADPIHFAQKFRDKPRAGPEIGPPRRTHLFDVAAVHYSQAVGERKRLFLIVRNKQKCHTDPTLQAFQFGAHLFRSLGSSAEKGSSKAVHRARESATAQELPAAARRLRFPMDGAAPSRRAEVKKSPHQRALPLRPVVHLAVAPSRKLYFAQR